MPRWLDRLLRKTPAYQFVDRPVNARLVLAQSCFDGLIEALAPANNRRHEGVALLLGKIEDGVGVGVHAVRPNAITTRGSFQIPASEMAKVVALATRLGLSIIGQVHTHPGEAFHSDGDEEGANIRYDGFFSLVIPEYGRFLPNLRDSVLYAFSSVDGWQRLEGRLNLVDGLTAL